MSTVGHYSGHVASRTSRNCITEFTGPGGEVVLTIDACDNAPIEDIEEALNAAYKTGWLAARAEEREAWRHEAQQKHLPV
jgi:hypothetical protein